VNADAMGVVAAGGWTVGVVCDGVSMSPRSDRAALVASVDAAPACTYVAAAVGAGGVWVSWVGDSRAYWLPDEGPGFALTEDDTGAHDALSAWLGADAGDLEGRARSYRPSGPGRLLLCTDGLWRYLSSAEELRAAVPRRRPGSAG
ncbi:protein phosphatase 2C domain-containing protein, partial [Nocardiopsis lucentensis]|uniref:protein phosphatase 2C domain-containing protein n=1 Tax=Nocardiopsis lucentensis TaxID=53441 RepID=UPI00037B5EC5